VVNRYLTNSAIVQAIRAAVSHIRDQVLGAVPQKSHQRRAHAEVFGPGVRFVEDHDVGQSDSFDQVASR
jgi:hypothetical protein